MKKSATPQQAIVDYMWLKSKYFTGNIKYMTKRIEDDILGWSQCEAEFVIKGLLVFLKHEMNRVAQLDSEMKTGDPRLTDERMINWNFSKRVPMFSTACPYCIKLKPALGPIACGLS